MFNIAQENAASGPDRKPAALMSEWQPAPSYKPQQSSGPLNFYCSRSRPCSRSRSPISQPVLHKRQDCSKRHSSSLFAALFGHWCRLRYRNGGLTETFKFILGERCSRSTSRARRSTSLAFVCEVAKNIEDHLTGGEDHAPRGPLSRLS
jgi:hypothetical protein